MKRTPTTRIAKVCAVCLSALLVLQLAACAPVNGEDSLLPIAAAAAIKSPQPDAPRTNTEAEPDALPGMEAVGDEAYSTGDTPAVDEATEPVNPDTEEEPPALPNEEEGEDKQEDMAPDTEASDPAGDMEYTPQGTGALIGEEELEQTGEEEEDEDEDDEEDTLVNEALLDREALHIKDLYALLHELGIHLTEENARSILTGFSLTFTDENGKEVESPTADSYAVMHLSFALPEELRKHMVAGDYYTFLLPEELQVGQNVSLTLVDADYGEEMATLAIDAGTGLVTVTFNENVANYNDIDLEAVISGKLNADALNGAGDTTIRIPFEDDSLSVEVTIRPMAESPIDKRGDFTRQFNPDEIVWQVDVNKTLESLTNVTLTESWPAHISLDTVEVYQVQLDVYGNVIEGSETPYTGAYSVNENGDITFPQLSCALRVVYTSAIDLDAVAETGESSISYLNVASLMADGYAKPVDAVANLAGRYGEVLDKAVDKVDNLAQTVAWRVRYNWNERVLNSPTLTDLYGAEGMSLQDGSLYIYPVAFAADGSYTIDTANPLTQGSDYTLEVTHDPETGEETGFKLRFINGLDYAVQIEYKTDVSGVVGSGGSPYANAIYDDDEHYSGGGGTITQATLDKSYTSLNYADKTVDVRLLFNRHGYSIQNPVITDTWKEGMTYVPGSLAISGGYEPEVDYFLAVDEESRTFTITFAGEPPVVNEALTITYQMEFDSQVKALGGRLENTAKVDWTAEDGKTHTHSDSARLTLTQIEQQNGAKGASYNAEDKTITWSLSLGYASTSLENAWLEDAIPEGQSYVPGSLQCYPYSVEAGGDIKVDRANPYDMQALGITYLEPDENGGTLRINLPGTQGRYYFEFKTSLEGYVVRDTYANTAYFYNEAHEIYKQELTASIEIPNGGLVAGKVGLDDGENGLWWLVTVNSSQSTLFNLQMVDEPSENQLIELDSLAVYKTTVAGNGEITPTEDTLTLGEDYTAAYTLDEDGQWRLRVSFLQQPVTEAYLVAYRAQVITEKETGNETLTNNVAITGENEELVPGSSGGTLQVDVSTATGVIRGRRGTLGVYKRCAVTGRALEGAVFQLYDQDGTPIGGPITTDKEGKASVSGLLYGDYTIREITSPEGYRLTRELAEGMEIELTRETAGADYYEEIRNQPTSVTLLKQAADDAAAPLPGAVFMLERYYEEAEAYLPWETENSLTTNDEGLLTLYALPTGAYRLTEVTAPAGYRLTGQLVHEFTLTADQAGEIAPVTINATNQPTVVTLQKWDENGEPLRDAEFALETYNEAAGEWQPYETTQDLVTGEDGLITLTALPAGQYRLIETTAPEGYRPNSAPIEFALEPGEEGDILPIALEFTNYPTEVTLQKQNEGGTALAGAAFLLERYDNEAGEWLAYETEADLVTGLDGTVTLTHLPAGTYRVTEITAPLGYVLDPFTSYEFTLAPDAEQNNDIVPMTLDPVLNTPTEVTVLKTDEDGEPLAGAEFLLEKRGDTETGEDTDEPAEEEGEEPAEEWSVVDYPERLVSDETGTITITGLPAGTYRLTETAAPDGYFAAAEPVQFTLAPDEDGILQPLTVGPIINTLSEASVTKIDPDGTRLAGCEFILEQFVPAGDDAAEALLAARALPAETELGVWQRILQDESLVTGEDGTVTVVGLAAGTYRFIEVVSPEGYTIDQTPLQFTLTAADTALVSAGEHANTPIEPEIRTPLPPAGPGGSGTPSRVTAGGSTSATPARRSSLGSSGTTARGIGTGGSSGYSSAGGRVQTGNNPNALPLAVLAGAVALVIAALAYGKRRRNNGKR